MKISCAIKKTAESVLNKWLCQYSSNLLDEILQSDAGFRHWLLNECSHGRAAKVSSANCVCEEMCSSVHVLVCLALDDCSSNSMQAFSTRLLKAMQAFAIHSSVNSAKFCQVCQRLFKVMQAFAIDSSVNSAKFCQVRQRMCDE